MSKGVDALDSISPDLLPTAWYSMSAKLKEFIKKAVIYITGEAATKWYYWLRHSKLLRWEKDIVSYNPDSGYVWHMGWVAALISRESYHEIKKDILDWRSAQDLGVLTAML